jgi:formylglycine-generating enzyme required for sulfatase activity
MRGGVHPEPGDAGRRAQSRRYRLPTEAEWEYAARAGANTQFFWGSNIDNGCVYANMLAAGSSDDPNRAHCRDGHAGVAPVGRFRPNAFGLFDTTGNVWNGSKIAFATVTDTLPAMPQLTSQAIANRPSCAVALLAPSHAACVQRLAAA